MHFLGLWVRYPWAEEWEAGQAYHELTSKLLSVKIFVSLSDQPPRELEDVRPSPEKDTFSSSRYSLLTQAGKCLVVVVTGCGEGRVRLSWTSLAFFFFTSEWGYGYYLPVKPLLYFLHPKSYCLKIITANLVASIYLTLVFRGHLFFFTTTLLNCPKYISGQCI